MKAKHRKDFKQERKIKVKNKKQKENKLKKILGIMRIIVIIIFIIIAIITGRKHFQSTNLEQKEDVKKAEEINFEEKEFEGMKIINSSIKKENQSSVFRAIIENNTNSDFVSNKVFIVFQKDNNVEIAKFSYILYNIKKGEKSTIELVTTTDLSNVTDFYIMKK